MYAPKNIADNEVQLDRPQQPTMAGIPWLPHVRFALGPIELVVTRLYLSYSFAYATMGERLPTILGKGIDDVVMTLNQEYDEERVIDLVKCIERMDALKHELQGQAKLRAIIDDGEADVALWNKLIAKYFRGECARFGMCT